MQSAIRVRDQRDTQISCKFKARKLNKQKCSFRFKGLDLTCNCVQFSTDKRQAPFRSAGKNGDRRFFICHFIIAGTRFGFGVTLQSVLFYDLDTLSENRFTGTR